MSVRKTDNSNDENVREKGRRLVQEKFAMKKIFIALISIAVAVYAFFLFSKENDRDNLTLYGNIEIRQVDVSFQASGQITEMLKEEGDKVNKGELLAVLDDRDYKANLEKAKADVLKYQALKNEAIARYERGNSLHKVNAVGVQDYESMQYAKDEAIASYNQALAVRDLAENQLAYTKIYAPDDGTVTVRVQEPGTVVAKGQTVYTVAKTKPAWIRAYVNEPDLGNIKYGMKAKIYTDTVNPQTGKKREYTGYIGYISPVAEFTPKMVQANDLRANLVYRIRVYIDEIDEFLRQGMPTTIKIDLHSNNI